jgi:processive 1,2-diacylglycerol beta-glucosyltransferase
MRVFGFVDTMAELMASSDLIVSKAGGLTVSEALGLGVPLVLYHVIPGQERLNADYVVRHGAGLVASGPSEVARAVSDCLEQPQRLAAMARQAKALGRPEAAKEIVDTVLDPLLMRRARGHAG